MRTSRESLVYPRVNNLFVCQDEKISQAHQLDLLRGVG